MFDVLTAIYNGWGGGGELIEKYISEHNFSFIKPTNGTHQICANSHETTQTHFGEIIPSSVGTMCQC